MPPSSPSDAEHSPAVGSVISFLFGLAERELLPGPALVELLEELGVSESAARSAIARMRGNGRLEGVRRGRVSDYRLVGAAASGFRHARGAAHPESSSDDRAWDGEFAGILLDVPEAQRRDRDRLRSAALLAGYASLRPGLMIAVADRWHLLEADAAALPAPASVRPLTLRMRPEDARAAASEAWDLPSLDRSLARLSARLHRGLDEGPADGDGAAAMRRLVDLTLPVYRTLIVVPALPPELLPERWSQGELMAGIGAAHAQLGGPAQAHVRAVLARHGAPSA